MPKGGTKKTANRHFEWKLFFSFFILYALFINHAGWNAESRFALTQAIVNNHTTQIDGYHLGMGDRAVKDGHYYSDKHPGQSLLAVPTYTIHSLLSGSIGQLSAGGPSSDSRYMGAIYTATLLTSCLLMAIACVLLFRILGTFTEDLKEKLLGTTLFGAGTFAFSQATIFTGHAVSTALVTAALYLTVKNPECLNKKNVFLSGIALGLGYVTDPLVLLLVPLFGGFILLRSRKANRTVGFILGFILGVIPLLIYSNGSFGNPLASPYQFVDLVVYSSPPFVNAMPSDNTCPESWSNQLVAFGLSLIPTSKDKCVKSYLVSYNEFGDTIKWTDSRGNWLELTNPSIVIGGKQGKIFTYSVNLATRDYVEYLFEVEDSNSSSTIFSSNRFSDNLTDWTFFLRRNKSDALVQQIYSGDTALYIEDACHLDVLSWENQGDFERMCTITKTDGGNQVYTFTALLNVSHVSTGETDRVRSVNMSFEHPRMEWNSRPKRILQLLFFPERGLFLYSPALFLIIPGFFVLWQRKRLETLLFVISVAVVIWANASLGNWWGGSTFGPRHLTIVLPLLVILAVSGIKKLGVKLACALILLSICIQLIGQQPIWGAPQENMVVITEGESVIVRYNTAMIVEGFTWKLSRSPLVTYYGPLSFTSGPRSVALDAVLQEPLPPMLNLFILSLSLLLIWRWEQIRTRLKSFRKSP